MLTLIALTAILMQADSLSKNEFSGEARAGFCQMGACQDCWVSLADGTRTSFAGEISAAALVGSDGGFARYRLRISHWIWRLAHLRNSRVWQDKSVTDIVDEVFGIHAPAGQPDWRRAWSGIWQRLAERHGALLLQDLYAPLAQVPATDRAPLLLRDGVHPSAQGVALIVRHLGPVAAQLVERAA